MSFSVLILEDQIDEWVPLSKHLKTCILEPIDLVICKNYEEAFGPVFSREWDLILINYHLNNRDGLETFKLIKGFIERRGTPVVLYHSMEEASELAQEVLGEGASAFLSKQEMVSPAGLSHLRELCFSH